MTIVFAASEMVPFCKTGGLADVLGALPPVLAGLGHDVHVILPGYGSIDRERFGFIGEDMARELPLGAETRPMTASSATWRGVSVHLVENRYLFDREGLYGGIAGDYPDNAARFIFFSRGVVEVIRALGIEPDIIHIHDWQAALVAPLVRLTCAGEPAFDNASVLFTIHNLGYQGNFGPEVFDLTGLPPEAFTWTTMEFWGRVSFLKGGIVYADAISTVSATYAEEITGETLGFGLHDVLAERRRDLHGIVNGIDTSLWDPATDSAIPARYSAEDLSGKAACREALLRTCGLAAKPTVPVIGIVTRLDDQKGLDIIEEAVGRLVPLDIRLVILGTGTKKHHEAMDLLKSRYPDTIQVMLRYDDGMARLIYSGADMFLMPSRYEPCGLGQFIAMRYGTLPIVRRTGGLADTVTDITADPRNGTGFSFGDYSAEALIGAMTRAVTLFRGKGGTAWTAAVQRAMRADFSWDSSARLYAGLYTSITGRNRTGR